MVQRMGKVTKGYRTRAASAAVPGGGGGALRRATGPGHTFTKAVPSVARAMPPAAGIRPARLFGANIPLVSRVIPLVSAVPPVAAPVYFGAAPTRTAEDIPRKRETPPSEMGLGEALFGYVLGAPLVLPVKMAQRIVEEVKAQAEAELDERSRLRGELLENAMRFEADQIMQEEYQARQAELSARLDQLRDEGVSE